MMAFRLFEAAYAAPSSRADLQAGKGRRLCRGQLRLATAACLRNNLSLPSPLPNDSKMRKFRPAAQAAHRSWGTRSSGSQPYFPEVPGQNSQAGAEAATDVFYRNAEVGRADLRGESASFDDIFDRAEKTFLPYACFVNDRMQFRQTFSHYLAARSCSTSPDWMMTSSPLADRRRSAPFSSSPSVVPNIV